MSAARQVALSFVLALGQAANLEEDRGRVVVQEDDLRVGRLAVVLVAEPAAEAHDVPGQRVLAQAPAAAVHVVDAHVAEVAVAGVPVPVPVVVQVLAHQGPLVGRAAPEVVVDRLRDRLRAGDLADALPRLVVEPVGVEDLAEIALADVLERLGEAGPLARAVRGLDDPLVLAGRLDHLAAFEDVVGRGLLDVHVLARLAGPDRRQRVPVVGRGDDDRVDVLVVEQLAQVGVRLDARIVRAELLDLRHEMGLVAVAQGGEAQAGNLQMRPDLVLAHAADLHARADADDAQADVVVGAENPGDGVASTAPAAREPRMNCLRFSLLILILRI